MSRFDRLPDRAYELANNVGDRIRRSVPSDVGDRILDAIPSRLSDRVRSALPSRSGGLLEAGVALGAMKTGGRVATAFVRRNPAVAVAAIAGAGLLWYVAHKRAQKAERGLLEGRSQRVDATIERVSDTAGDKLDDAADTVAGVV